MDLSAIYALNNSIEKFFKLDIGDIISEENIIHTQFSALRVIKNAAN